MTKSISRTTQFKKDVKLALKRGKDIDKLKEVLELLINQLPLPARFRDHLLIGQYKGTRECHIEPDWLLIYEDSESEIVLIRTGSHNDLFE